jgi:hypothetical protein
VVWFDKSPQGGSLDVTAGVHGFTIPSAGTGAWKESSFSLPNNQFDRVVLRAKNGSVVLHMVEISRI